MEPKPSLLELARRSSGAVGAFFGLTILANAFVVYFVTQEHYIYFWDTAIYWHMYIDLSTSLLSDPASGLRALIHSVRYDDYNLLPALPLVPFAWMFGSGRLTYILAITNVALLPGALIMGLSARRIMQRQSAEGALSSVVLSTVIVLAVHSMWVPMLRGYPDVIGVLVIGGILLLHFAKPLADQGLVVLVATGLLLCILVLLRRYYAFWVVAFFPALIFAQYLDIFQRHESSRRRYIITARNAGVIGLTFTFALFAIATPLMLKILHTDYSDIYSAYKSSLSMLQAAGRLPIFLGWSVIVCGLSGLAWLTVKKETRIVGIFLITQSLIVFVLFARTQDFGIQHHYLLIPSFVLGIQVVVISLWKQAEIGIWRVAAVGTLLFVLLANFTTFSPSAASISIVLGRLIPQYKCHPLVRNDLEELNLLLDRLDELVGEQPGEIYVLASSVVLNSSILQNACHLGTRSGAACGYILATNDVDKRDGFPHQFLQAKYLVVANPTQYHLRADDQRVIGVLAREVLTGQGIGASFQRLPGDFKLDNEVAVGVFVKVRPIERMDFDALENEFARYYPNLRLLQ